MRYLILLTTLVFLGCSHAQKQAEPTKSVAVDSDQKNLPKPVVEKANPDDHKLRCKNGEDIRSLEMTAKPNSCSLNYTKNKKTSVVASSASGIKHCENTLKKIREKLEKAGFECS